MDRATNSTAPADRLFCAMELSKNSWLLGIQFPDRQKASVYPIKGGDSEGLMTKLVAACDRWAKLSGKKPSIILCYEAGYDAFWLARFLGQRYISNDPFHPPIASMWLGVAYFMLRRYSEALPCLRVAARRAPNLRAARVHLAANFAQLNQIDAARRQVDAALCIEPTFTIDYQRRLAAVCRHDRDIAHHLDALRRAGLSD